MLARRPRGFVFSREDANRPTLKTSDAGVASEIDGHLGFEPEEIPTALFVYEPADLNDFSLEEVQAVWNQRKVLCGTIEAAAEVLAVLRVGSGADPSYRGWRYYLSHELILALREYLPQIESPIEQAPERSDFDATDMLTDRRQVVVRNTRLRSGQADFRSEVLAFHHERCCVTGCGESVLLEAAHIVPYRGTHSHDVQNGLCLRVDIHRLFDRYLLSIDPESFQLLVAPSLTDPSYQSLAGRRLFRSDNAPSRDYLRLHFQKFLEINER
jgi:hypothetical protein